MLLHQKYQLSQTIGNILTVLIVVAALAFFLFYLPFLNHVPVNSVGIAYDSSTGHVYTQEPGWHVTDPFTFTTDRSTLPFRVSFATDAPVNNTRILRFKPEGAIEYVHYSGFSYGVCRPFDSEMLGYSLSGKTFTFLEEIK